MHNVGAVQEVEGTKSVVHDDLQVVDTEADLLGTFYGLTQGLFDKFHDNEHVVNGIVLVDVEGWDEHIIDLSREDVLFDSAQLAQELHLAEGLLGFVLGFEDVHQEFDGDNFARFPVNGLNDLTVGAGPQLFLELIVSLCYAPIFIKFVILRLL